MSDYEVLAEGGTFLLVKSEYGYQIWKRSEIDEHRRDDLPLEEFKLNTYGQHAAWSTFAQYEPDAVATPTAPVAADGDAFGSEHAARIAVVRELSLGDEIRLPPLLAITPRLDVAGHRIISEHGLVTGSTARARGLGAKIVAGVTQNFGGELPGYTRLLQNARHEAVVRMSTEARLLGANAIVAVQFTASELFEIAVELLAYGAAVTVEPLEEPLGLSERND